MNILIKHLTNSTKKEDLIDNCKGKNILLLIISKDNTDFISILKSIERYYFQIFIVLNYKDIENIENIENIDKNKIKILSDVRVIDKGCFISLIKLKDIISDLERIKNLILHSNNTLYLILFDSNEMKSLFDFYSYNKYFEMIFYSESKGKKIIEIDINNETFDIIEA